MRVLAAFRSIAITAAFLLASASVFAASPTLDRVYAFGDSFIDNGAGYGITLAMASHGYKDAYAKPPTKFYRDYRWSNGKTMVEVMAKQLGLPLSDYAVGGAESGIENYDLWMNRAQFTGVLAQVVQFVSSHANNEVDPHGLYFIMAGANNFYAHQDYHQPTTIMEVASRAAGDIFEAVRILAEAGGRHFVVGGSVILDHAPYFVQQGTAAVEDAREFERDFTKAMQHGLKELAISNPHIVVTFLDVERIDEQIVSHANEYGITHLDTPCQPTYPKPGKACVDPQAYYFWDEYHPTKRTHEILGRDFAMQVEKVENIRAPDGTVLPAKRPPD